MAPRRGRRGHRQGAELGRRQRRPNDQQNPEELYVSACYADEGATLKRWRPRARGRATRIRKRTCHITVVVSRLPSDKLALRRGRMEAVSANRSRRVDASRPACRPLGPPLEAPSRPGRGGRRGRRRGRGRREPGGHRGHGHRYRRRVQAADTSTAVETEEQTDAAPAAERTMTRPRPMRQPTPTLPPPRTRATRNRPARPARRPRRASK